MSDRHPLADSDTAPRASDVEPAGPAERPAPRRRRGRRIALVVLLALVLLAGGGALAGSLYYR
ncbi:hypothetical protein [Micromonospora sp. WMMD980]|uniref:hypothetical protein n=1 Tax=Micromonospora sp. WMMD980 TaxID=3016088 RepID=UPI003241BF2E